MVIRQVLSQRSCDVTTRLGPLPLVFNCYIYPSPKTNNLVLKRGETGKSLWAQGQPLNHVIHKNVNQTMRFIISQLNITTGLLTMMKFMTSP